MGPTQAYPRGNGMIHDLERHLMGISGILVAPFDEAGHFTSKPLVPIIDRAIDAGIHNLVANGNTGEFYALTSSETETFIRSTAEIVDDRIPLLAGVGKSVVEACSLARISKKAGAFALMIHQPPDPFVSPRGFVDYVKHIRDASGGLPLILYIRDDTIGIDAIAELCSIDTVKAVKWATPNPMQLAKAMKGSPDHIIWIGGLAETWAPAFYAVGARGFTSGLINVWPEQSAAIHYALETGDFQAARNLIAHMSPFEEIRSEEMNGTNVTGVKTALQIMGLDCGAARPPAAWPPTLAQRSSLLEFIIANELLDSFPAAEEAQG